MTASRPGRRLAQSCCSADALVCTAARNQKFSLFDSTRPFHPVSASCCTAAAPARHWDKDVPLLPELRVCGSPRLISARSETSGSAVVAGLQLPDLAWVSDSGGAQCSGETWGVTREPRCQCTNLISTRIGITEIWILHRSFLFFKFFGALISFFFSYWKVDESPCEDCVTGLSRP